MDRLLSTRVARYAKQSRRVRLAAVDALGPPTFGSPIDDRGIPNALYLDSLPVRDGQSFC